MITVEGLIYIFAIAFQLAGAELLIMNYWGKPISILKKQELDKETHVEEETLVLRCETESEIVSNIRLNRIAFIMIAIGYVVGIFGDVQNSCKWFVAICVIILSVLLALAGNKIAERKSSG